MDFEQANTNHLAYDPGSGVTSGPIGELLPGWQVVVSQKGFQNGGFPGYTNVLTTLAFNSTYFDQPNIALTDRDYSEPYGFRTGNYSLSISPAQGTITVSQRADVPLDAQTFRAYGIISGIGNSVVSMNGSPLQVVDRHLDVSPYLGQNVDLQITFEGGSAYFREDSYSFYFVPEPPVWALGLCGACVLLGAAAKRHRS
jgi:hypothetical protein